mmetsp:Transcript_29202/g.45153  ORF Transcript_29202/g.45153 Transcript_29202/m.45153 type:complete len:607 (-) Transcript_29202:128-1948(-)
MLAYNSAGNSPYSREAVVVVTTADGCVYRLSVDLVDKDQIEVLDHCLSVQPSVTISEFNALMDIIMQNSTAVTALLDRGGDLNTTFCVPYSAGSYGDPAEDTIRMVRATCYSQEDTQNFWGRPIEGLIFEIDLDKNVIHSITDLYEDNQQIPTAENIDFNEESFDKDKVNPGPNIFQLYQKDGPSFSVSGSKIKWDGWEFHVRPDPRTGYYLSLASFQPTGQERRQVFYEASLAEMFVPYMEETYGWNTKTFFDVGEYGFGMLSNSLKKGVSVPQASHCFSSNFASDVPNEESGGIDISTITDNVCVFERYHDTTQWLHIEPLNNPPYEEVRQKTTLVIRAVATLGNYDYILDMEFGIDGSVRFVVAATGILAVKGEFDPHSTPTYGTRMTPELSATFHDHWFSFRLDLDVDGPEKNTFVQTHLENKRFTTGLPRKSGWAVTEEKATTENEGKLDLDYSKPVIWRVINNEKRTTQGNNLVSYALFPATNTYTLLSPDDYPQQRAAFTEHNLWVTPYDRDEVFSSGWYPNQNPHSKGLPEWTANNRNIDNTDVVVWYTMGFHHVPRQEDWPVMPTTSFEFSLMPVNFFEVNPSVNVANKEVPKEICL